MSYEYYLPSTLSPSLRCRHIPMPEAKRGQFQVISFAQSQTSRGRVQDYKSRKWHRKSQKGCMICKKRRVRVSASQIKTKAVLAECRSAMNKRRHARIASSMERDAATMPYLRLE